MCFDPILRAEFIFEGFSSIGDLLEELCKKIEFFFGNPYQTGFFGNPYQHVLVRISKETRLVRISKEIRFGKDFQRKT